MSERAPVYPNAAIPTRLLLALALLLAVPGCPESYLGAGAGYTLPDYGVLQTGACVEWDHGAFPELHHALAEPAVASALPAGDGLRLWTAEPGMCP